MQTYYLSGPMTGLPDLNYPKFADVTAILRARGDKVYSPAEWEAVFNVDGDPVQRKHARPFDLTDAFSDYCEFIIFEASAVVVLEGWENSPGANAEVALARALGKPVLRWPTLAPLPAWNRPPECTSHVERQRRDGLPKHCHACGWRHARPASPAKKIGTSRAEREANRAAVREAKSAGRAAGDIERTSEVP